jgi:hypothetical protein
MLCPKHTTSGGTAAPLWPATQFVITLLSVRLRLKCDGTRAETRFRLSAKRTSPFKSAGASVQSTTGSRGVRISGSNAGYTMFRGSVKGTDYPLHSPVSPFTSPPLRHRVPSHFNWTLSAVQFTSVNYYRVVKRTSESCFELLFFISDVVMCPLSLQERPAQKEYVSNAVNVCFNVFTKALHRTQSICSDAGIVDDTWLRGATFPLC